MARRRAALPRVGQLHLRALDRAGTEAQVASLLGTAPHYALVADVFSHTPTPTSRSSSIVDSERWASLVRGNTQSLDASLAAGSPLTSMPLSQKEAVVQPGTVYVCTRRASCASSTRLAVPVLCSRFETCTLTVFSLSTSSRAISL